MRDTNYILWLGQENLQLTGDIRKAVTYASSNSDSNCVISQKDYELLLSGDIKIKCDYTLIAVPARYLYDHHMSVILCIEPKQ